MTGLADLNLKTLQLCASFGIGAAFMLANLLLLAWVWSRFLDKKPVAWTVVIIVGKYLLLLGGIFLLAQKPWFHVIGAGLGMSALMFMALLKVAVMIRE